MTPEDRLKELGLELPSPPKPVGAYAPAVRCGNLIFTAGQIPFRDGELLAAGKVPADISVEIAQACAMQAMLNALAVVRQAIGDGVPAGQAGEPGGSLQRVARVVRLNVFINSAPGFADHAKVANAASELLLAAFGEAGRHTRCAVGAAALPLNAPIELDLIVEVRDGGGTQ